MKLIRLIAPTSTASKSEFTNRFEDNITIQPESEIALVNCTLPIALKETYVISSDLGNNQFSMEFGGFYGDPVVRTVTIADGTYNLTDLLSAITTGLNRTLNYDFFIQGDSGTEKNYALGIEFNVTIDDKSLINIGWDCIAEVVNPWINPNDFFTFRRYGGVEGLEYQGENLVRNQTVGADSLNGGWVLTKLPVSARMGELTCCVGTSPKFDADVPAAGNAIPVAFGLVSVYDEPSDSSNLNFGNGGALAYGFRLEADRTATILHDGVDTVCEIDRTQAVADGEVTDPGELDKIKDDDIFVIRYAYGGTNTIQGQVINYDIQNKDGVSVVKTNNLDYNDQTVGIVKNMDVSEEYLLAAGIAKGAGGQISQLTWVPTIGLLKQQPESQLPRSLTLDFLNTNCASFYGFNRVVTKNNNFSGPGLFKGSTAIDPLGIIPSIVIYLNNLTLDCYDAGQTSDTNEGRRRSIIGVIPSSFRDQFQISYEPTEKNWIPVNNKFPINMREIEWGLAEGNTFSPFLALSSVLTIAIREKE